MTNIEMNSEDDAKEKQGSIVVPIDDMDTVSSEELEDCINKIIEKIKNQQQK